jgi:serine/threonine protein kinase
MTGSLRYMAPEVARREPYTEKVDVYSFGVVVWQTITSKTPYSGLNRESFEAQVINGGKRPNLNELDASFYEDGKNDFMVNACEEIKDICSKCWDPDYKLRPEMRDLTDSLSKMYYDYAHGAAAPEGCCVVM